MADCARALATAALLLFGPVCNGGSKDRLATTNASNVRRPAGLASLSRQSGQAGIDRTDELEQYGSGPPGKRITTQFRPPGRVANSSACRCNADRDDISRRSRSLGALRISVGMRTAVLRHFSSLHGFEIPSLARAL